LARGSSRLKDCLSGWWIAREVVLARRPTSLHPERSRPRVHGQACYKEDVKLAPRHGLSTSNSFLMATSGIRKR
jgi:hypothetical protein